MVFFADAEAPCVPALPPYSCGTSCKAATAARRPCDESQADGGPRPAFEGLQKTEVRDQTDRVISTGQLRMLPYFHLQPINVVVFHGSQGISGFEGGFPLRCFQRLSRPYLATLQCHGRDNRSTRGTSTPV